MPRDILGKPIKSNVTSTSKLNPTTGDIKTSSKSVLPYRVDAPRKIYKIKAENWDKDLPYYFTVVKAQPGTGKARLSDKVSAFDVFALPINPSSLAVSVPFAINVYPTTRGIVEEFNGTVFRNITISGTTGVTPKLLRSGGYDKKDVAGPVIAGVSNDTLGGFASNTLGAASNLISTVKGFGGDAEEPLTKAVKEADIWEFGHAQLHKLANYLVAYSEYKKTGSSQGKVGKKDDALDEAKRARLVFVSQKDNTAYVVTPVSFEFTKSVENPHAFNYKILLRAYDLAENDAVEGNLDNALNKYFQPIDKDPNLLARAFDLIQNSRAIISSSHDTIKAVVADMEAVFTIIGEVMSVVKSLVNLTRTLADFPNMVKDSWKHMVGDLEKKAADIKSDPNRLNTQKNKNIDNSLKELLSVGQSAVKEADPTNPTGIPVASDSLAKQTEDQIRLDIKNPIASFEQFSKNVDFLDEYLISDFELTAEQEELLNTQINQALNKTIADYDEMRRQMEAARDAYADYNEFGDDDYNAAAGRTTVNTASKTPTNADYKIIQAFNDIISVIDGLSATNDIIRLNVPDPFVRAQEIVEGSNIVIRSSNVAYPIPFPHNGTLEQLAGLYLNDPDRWIEIAILNELKPPYIDEDGFERVFSSSGSGNSFTVTDKSNLFLNQEIWISSIIKRAEIRHITKIDEIGVDNYLITVDGDADLDEFTIAHSAQMKAYLPNTINSNKIIFIPFGSDIADQDLVPDTREIPASKDLDKQQKLMGIDLALTKDYDLAMTNSGDIKLTSGYNNAIQALKIKVTVNQGELKRHPEYGAGLNIGERLDMSAEDVRDIIENTILSDPRFESLSSITVEFKGSTVSLNLIVNASNGGGVIPIKFKL